MACGDRINVLGHSDIVACGRVQSKIKKLLESNPTKQLLNKMSKYSSDCESRIASNLGLVSVGLAFEGFTCAYVSKHQMADVVQCGFRLGDTRHVAVAAVNVTTEAGSLRVGMFRDPQAVERHCSKLTVR
jgi:hypothetical protein